MHTEERALAQLLTRARERLGISSRELARRSGVTNSTVRRLELGEIPQPRPETLKSLADVLGLDVSDLYAAIGYAQPQGLPSFTPYLRSKYADLPDAARAELEASFSHIARKYGYHDSGPLPGEDEK